MSEDADIVKIRASRTMLEDLFLRDADGYRLKLEWSDPGPEGFTGLTVTRDIEDNLYDHWESEYKRMIDAFRGLLESAEWQALEQMIAPTKDIEE